MSRIRKFESKIELKGNEYATVNTTTCFGTEAASLAYVT
jgi:hypothetical protein